MSQEKSVHGREHYVTEVKADSVSGKIMAPEIQELLTGIGNPEVVKSMKAKWAAHLREEEKMLPRIILRKR